MIIYEDVFTGNEVFSDAYPCKLIDDFYFEAEGQVITIDNSIDESAIGGNASAEDGAEDTEDVKETAINLVYAFKLKPYECDKRTYQKHISAYGKKLVDKMTAAGKTEEEVLAFKTKMGTICKNILKSKRRMAPLAPLQKCSNDKERSIHRNHWNPPPPHSPNAWAELAHFLARGPSSSISSWKLS